MMVSCYLCQKEILTEADPHAHVFHHGEWKVNCGCFFSPEETQQELANLLSNQEKLVSLLQEASSKLPYNHPMKVKIDNFFNPDPMSDLGEFYGEL
jgi:hypothetical protein